ncbi:MAG: divergent polysaccharide deacetylase family protein [Deltaproteobacteria bacterium]|uniref:Divergent polysaccharide deacetylase family protein n=1 Tax=Candidatus Zymogenus saltonus TaxID=2844893 RepID=A0A9D8KFI7_9DELT|nr:divergent polysaccharide deacetylase family protein [Candidatus Zymogenus saltonus]
MTKKKAKNKNKGERAAKTPKTAIRSPKKKPKNRVKGLIETKGRYIALSALLLCVIVALIFVAVGLIRKRVEPVFPGLSITGTPVHPTDGVFKIERDILAVNEEITGSLLDLGYSESSLKSSDEKAKVVGAVHFREISESYSLKGGDDKGEILEFLSGRLEGFGDDVSVRETDVAGGGFYFDFYVYDYQVRRLTFLTSSSKAPKITIPPVVKPAPKIAIIMDDMGISRGFIKELLALKYPVTVSVLPHQPSTYYVADLAHKKGAEVMLHLPMEPIDYPNKNPGPGALFTYMDGDTFKNSLASDLASVPHVAGVNNHMGSRLTQDEEKMRLVLDEIGKRGLFFVDSRTTHLTVAYRLAVSMGVPAIERSVFLDNENDLNAVRGRLNELIAVAKRDGRALGICHPRSETIRALKSMEPALTSGAVKVVTVKELLKAKKY